MAKSSYVKPELVKHENLKEITFGCDPSWQCSVPVPPDPTGS